MKKMIYIGIVLWVALWITLFPFVKSMGVMAVYSAYEHHHSILKAQGIHMRMPGGITTLKRDWYPFVMTFNPHENSVERLLGMPAKMTILYNFGHFNHLKGASSLYDAASPYYGSFYGAYGVYSETDVFGFNADGSVDADALSLVPSFDMRVLVLESIGCKDPIFEYEITEITAVETYVGMENWVQVDSVVTTHSPIHQMEEKHLAYLQYGNPKRFKHTGEDFPIITLYGRMYATYIESAQTTLCFYVLATDLDTLEKTDADFLARTRIKLRN